MINPIYNHLINDFWPQTCICKVHIRGWIMIGWNIKLYLWILEPIKLLINPKLVGVFKDFLCSPLLTENDPIWLTFLRWAEMGWNQLERNWGWIWSTYVESLHDAGASVVPLVPQVRDWNFWTRKESMYFPQNGNIPLLYWVYQRVNFLGCTKIGKISPFCRVSW